MSNTARNFDCWWQHKGSDDSNVMLIVAANTSSKVLFIRTTAKYHVKDQ